MADKAMDVYLNDHLAGAMFGSDLAEQLQQENEGTALGEVMSSLAPQIEEDRELLIDLMEQMGTSKNPVKQATTWLAEKASRPKFSGLMSREPELGTFMALETLMLGVEGKLSLWKVLKEVADQYEPLGSTDFRYLIERAQSQHSALERERVAAGKRALSGETARLSPRSSAALGLATSPSGRLETIAPGEKFWTSSVMRRPFLSSRDFGEGERRETNPATAWTTTRCDSSGLWLRGECLHRDLDRSWRFESTAPRVFRQPRRLNCATGSTASPESGAVGYVATRLG